MAARAPAKKDIPENIAEEYYQISQDILSSFPKFRPPVDLFQFRDDISQLYPFSRKGARLTNEQVEAVSVLCDAGSLFVSRSDLHIYSEHIIKQVDLVLLDANLKEAEIAVILVRALQMRVDAFLEQPVRPVFDLLYRDLMVLTEFLWHDRHRAKLFMRRLHVAEYSLSAHMLNALFVGLWLYIYVVSGSDFKRRTFDRVTLALALMNIGMSKIPPFILAKEQQLKPEEREKILLHPLAGIKIAQKLELGFEELKQAMLEHHERLDGSGYPNHSRDALISRVGKMAAVADAFAAMITKRVYASAKLPLSAAQELAADKVRFDSSMTTPLANSYLTGSFDLPLAGDALPAEGRASSAGGNDEPPLPMDS